MELHRQTYLDEMVRWAGRGDAGSTDKCPDCLARSSPIVGAPEYRCEYCFLPDLTCATCCVKRHRGLPLHWIEVRFFFKNGVNYISHGLSFLEMVGIPVS